MQTCSTSSTQSVIEFTAYNNGSDKYALLDVVLDSSMNKYILHVLDGYGVKPNIAKISPTGTLFWTKTYSDFRIYRETKHMTLSTDETKIRMITRIPSEREKFLQISTGNIYSTL